MEFENPLPWPREPSGMGLERRYYDGRKKNAPWFAVLRLPQVGERVLEPYIFNPKAQGLT
jgi:hypothetical protein